MFDGTYSIFCNFSGAHLTILSALAPEILDLLHPRSCQNVPRCAKWHLSNVRQFYLSMESIVAQNG